MHHNKLYFILIFCIILLSGLNSHSQEKQRDELINSLIEEVPLKQDLKAKKILNNKLFEAEAYLEIELKKYVIDTTVKSNLYQEKTNELKKLENTTTYRDKKLEKEKLLLLLSALSTSNSYKHFYKLINSYLIDDIGYVKIKKSGFSFINYQHWLIIILQKRFPEEEKLKLIESYIIKKKTFLLTSSEFKNVSTEKKLQEELEFKIKETIADTLVETYKEFICRMYCIRASLITEADTIPSDTTIVNFLIDTYKNAINNQPMDYHANYNLGVLYHNFSIRINNYFKNEENPIAIDMLISSYKEKAKYYMNIANSNNK